MIDKIYNENIKIATEKIIETYGSDEKNLYAERVAYWCMKLLEKRGILNENVQQVFVDIIYAAALTHNLLVDDSDQDNKYYDVFNARREYRTILSEVGLPEEYIQSWMQLIESQFGESSPIPQIRPNPDTPQSTMSEAKFIVDTILENNINYAI